MASLVHALDRYTPKQLGENNNVEYTWSHEMNERIVQFFFQLVRSKKTNKLENTLFTLLSEIKKNEKKYIKQMEMLYLLIGQTRDLVNGKGEYNLTFMMLYEWYKFYPDLAEFGFWTCVIPTSEIAAAKFPHEHQYGSWKDVKYMIDYIKTQLAKENPSLTESEVIAMAKKHGFVRYMLSKIYTT